ncbi:glycerol-3-phosphate acyltransferase [Candidatus Woesearchaeota archaeon]|nr:glycerol-3-phosphate acyltransferase [Candidatus Woesearchaeota archaeon]
MLTEMIFTVLSYLIGAVSPSYFAAKTFAGIDIRRYGNKTAGALNTYEVIGFMPAITVAILDAGKAFFVVVLSVYLGFNIYYLFLIGLAAIMGNIFPFYLDFEGGHGLATTAGVALASLFLFGRERASYAVILIAALILSYIITRNVIKRVKG